MLLSVAGAGQDWTGSTTLCTGPLPQVLLPGTSIIRTVLVSCVWAACAWAVGTPPHADQKLCQKQPDEEFSVVEKRFFK